jgi:hypothetical protein
MSSNKNVKSILKRFVLVQDILENNDIIEVHLDNFLSMIDNESQIFIILQPYNDKTTEMIGISANLYSKKGARMYKTQVILRNEHEVEIYDLFEEKIARHLINPEERFEKE